MKKALVILLALTMVMSMFAMVPASAADEELAVGQVAADYKPEGEAIKTAEEFANMKADGKYYLANDITISETYGQNFTGTFDGNGKTITTSINVFGEFNGVAKNVTIKGSFKKDVKDARQATSPFIYWAASTGDTVIDNVCNQAVMESSAMGMAGIVGFGGNSDKKGADSYKLTITNCANYGNIACSFATQANNDSGGIIGYFMGTAGTDIAEGEEPYQLVVDNCVNYGIINAMGRPGGIIGNCDASAKVTNCVNYGDIQAIGNYCGGVIGRLGHDDLAATTEFLVENCVNYGSVRVYKSQGAGIMGYGNWYKMEYKNCVNRGVITGNEINVVDVVLGGIHGNNAKTSTYTYFTNCANYGKIGDINWAKSLTAGGIAGGARATTTGCIIFEGCYNYADMEATNRAAGIAGGAPWSDNGSDTQFLSCGNYGNVTSTKQAGGICSYSYGTWTQGPVVKYCVTTGDITGGTFTAGLVAYVNTGAESADMEYNIIAGKMKGMTNSTVNVADGDKVVSQKMYTFNYDGTDYYFYAPEAGKVAIDGKKVTFTADAAIAPQVVTNGTASSANNCLVIFELDGKKYLSLAAGTKGGIITIDEENLKVVCNDIPVKAVEVPATFDNKTLELQVFDHNIGAAAFLWNNKATIEVDTSKNFIAEGTADVVAIQGIGNKWLSVNTTEIAARTPIADFANGTVAYALNEMIGEDVFYQNINEDLFVVDAFPTTDATHAKVVKVAGVIGNQLFDLENASGSPATGDAIVYVVVALAVSTISLAAVAVVKKIKEN